MSHDPVPPLRCEIQRPAPELRWLTWGLTLMMVVGTLVDALWLIPAQRAAARCPGARAVPTAPAPAPRAIRVDDVLLLPAP